MFFPGACAGAHYCIQVRCVTVTRSFGGWKFPNFLNLKIKFWRSPTLVSCNTGGADVDEAAEVQSIKTRVVKLEPEIVQVQDRHISHIQPSF